jgi:lysozyme
MTPEAKLKLRQLLTKHEDIKLFPYADTIKGKLTIGCGRNLTDRGISLTEAFTLLDDDIIYFSAKLAQYLPWFSELSENRQIALIDLTFNVGVQGVLNFTNFLHLLEQKDYVSAADDLLKTKWADQVGERAPCLANIIMTDTI